MNKLYKTKLKRNDTVIVISGREKGKKGKILRIDLKKGRVFIEGVNLLHKSVRKKKQSDRDGIIMIEGSINLSNVQLVDKNGKTTRVSYQIENNKKHRISTKTGDKIE